jgi:predicted regulator of Ras-like GTPase activity (Roadblock/LC7/MglB family)
LPYQSILDGLTGPGSGVEAALLVDSEGEGALHSGRVDRRHRLIGAYQGIALSAARRTGDRYPVGDIRYMLCRYQGAIVILRPLKDGYFLVLAVDPRANLGRVLYESEAAQARMNEAL